MTRLPGDSVVDCLVVGGGPVGLLTAVFLDEAGLRVAVVERWGQRYPLPRACTIDHEASRILQAGADGAIARSARTSASRSPTRALTSTSTEGS